ncbi:Peptidase M3A and M3B thimet/oligopeptidase F [Bacillus mycoides]|uniref:M3 family metallopeptidase n=1 Tax=Bacillus mycoides TaxID=1405 RepID=UPI0001A0512A|nr:M3 family metallopeptidase [Bacillus mycoides]EEL05801.1 Peptidase M3A and M3B thimet/oligopeptidase F [Bacillus cereus BDRD-ST196]AIW84794.1 Peptidase M3A and M3B thimet/oligopeptidase F [Bacillus mycoides]TKI34885.1 M3 family oligoendopeptidase [Bacillus mycoides]GAE37999.1 peptidase M3 family protein [Bacillus mycoides NBRC 101238 = DSM 11821]HDR7594768.1 oligoendopeptidase F [Bacillus mycoides]
MNKIIQAQSQWDLDRLYPQEQNFTFSIETIERLKIEYKATKDTVTLSQLIQAIEKAEYYLYCRSTEEDAQPENALLSVKINQLKKEVQLLIESSKQQDIKTNNLSIKLIENELKAWEDMYIQLRNKLEITHDKETLSFGQANYVAMNSDDHNERLIVFDSLTNTLNKEKDIFATVLNQIGRLRHAKSDEMEGTEILKQSLQANGISETALSQMWNATEQNLTRLVIALNGYKEGKNLITWYELMTWKESNETVIPFSVAVKNVYDALKNIDEELAQFAQNAIANGWIDAEPRDNKPPGGFCAPFFSEKESRISLRYDGTIDSVRVLAHELGHAWHFYVMSLEQSTSFLDDYLPMSTAESASIFFETVIMNYLIQTTDCVEMKKSLLSWKIRNSFNYVMAIRASFQFEKKFYEECKEGPLSADEIEKLSIAAQEKAYGNALTEYQPFVWMKYVQFYIADVPFYNYPYTFGYLASFSLIEIAKENKNKNAFHLRYKEFLRETGKAPVEELMKKHFDIDLTEYEFWNKAFMQIHKDIDEYLQIN